MAGIERIDIENANLGYKGGSGRFWEPKRHGIYANRLYRSIFKHLSIELVPDDKLMQCSSDDFLEGYDRALGIDTFFHFANGMTGTLQEKCLAYLERTTVTIEYMQNPQDNEHGDWFNIKAQFYFVGYDSLHIQCPPRANTIRQEIETGICQTCGHPFEFQAWILLNWPMVVLESAKGNIEWQLENNRHDHARASFQYADFAAFPSSCVIDKYEMDNRKEWTITELYRRRKERLG